MRSRELGFFAPGLRRPPPIDSARAGARGAAAGGPASGTYEAPFRAFLVPWADDAANEAAVRAQTRFSLRCFPHALQAELAPDAVCFYSGRPATHMALFARAF